MELRTKRAPKWPLLAVGATVLLASVSACLHWNRSKSARSTAPQDGLGARNFATAITPANVTHLHLAWNISSGDLSVSTHPKSAFESTPLFYNNTLVIVTPTAALLCVDAITGKTKWRFTPPGYDSKAMCTKRGASLWIGGSGAVAFYCFKSRLIAVDADTGLPAAGFGVNGSVQLEHLPEFGRWISYNSPPLVAGDRVICGSAIGDNTSTKTPEGIVTAFDCHSGAVLWDWHPIVANLKRPSGQRLGSANVWATMSYDAHFGAVYAVTTSPTPDSFGGFRPGNNEYADSAVCLDAATGRVRWARQLLHHNLWDYDLPAQPLLLDYKRGSTTTDAVAIISKQGFMFLLDRVTGQPLFPIREVPVPKGSIPGEWYSPTEPEPIAPPPLAAQGVPGQPLFTPPSFQGTTQLPGTFGGCNWSGMSYDRARRLIITTTNNIPTVVRLARGSKTDPKCRPETSPPTADGSGPMEGTPYKAFLQLQLKNGVPLVKPPWGTIVAVDPAKGSIVWQHPLGYVPAVHAMRGYEHFGSPNLGGAITTTTGLTFVAGTLDHHLRAIETATGKELASWPLPFGGQAGPMLYTCGAKDYVVICCGGHFAIDRTFGNRILAFSN